MSHYFASHYSLMRSVIAELHELRCPLVTGCSPDADEFYETLLFGYGGLQSPRGRLIEWLLYGVTKATALPSNDPDAILALLASLRVASSDASGKGLVSGTAPRRSQLVMFHRLLVLMKLALGGGGGFSSFSRGLSGELAPLCSTPAGSFCLDATLPPSAGTCASVTASSAASVASASLQRFLLAASELSHEDGGLGGPLGSGCSQRQELLPLPLHLRHALSRRIADWHSEAAAAPDSSDDPLGDRLRRDLAEDRDILARLPQVEGAGDSDDCELAGIQDVQELREAAVELRQELGRLVAASAPPRRPHRESDVASAKAAELEAAIDLASPQLAAFHRRLADAGRTAELVAVAARRLRRLERQLPGSTGGEARSETLAVLEMIAAAELPLGVPDMLRD